MSSLVRPIPRIYQRQNHDTGGGICAHRVDDVHVFQGHGHPLRKTIAAILNVAYGSHADLGSAPETRPGRQAVSAEREECSLDAKPLMFYFCSMLDEAAQLDQMREIAFRLGMSLGQSALAEDDIDRKLTLLDAFHRSFAAVRLSIALKMRLAREARTAPRAEAERAETDGPETESLEAERAEQPERPERFDERDRDREAERASFPLLLRTLRRVADDAETLQPQAAELPALRELLDRVGAQPAPAARPAGPLRERLSGGTAALTLTAPPRPGPSGLRGLPPRRSTGPPRR